MDLERLKSTLDNSTYDELRGFLLGELNSLRDIDNIREYSKAQDQALEVRAQKKAYEKLRNILSQIMTIHDSEPVEENTGEDYGLE